MLIWYRWCDVIDEITEGLDNALDIAFLNRPQKIVAPTTSIQRLAGTYYDPGYKNLTLQVKSHIDTANEVLVGFRENDTWPIRFDLHHVSSDWWIMYMEEVQSPTIFSRGFARAEFEFGVDGSPTALVMQFDMSKSEAERRDTRVRFNKIA